MGGRELRDTSDLPSLERLERGSAALRAPQLFCLPSLLVSGWSDFHQIQSTPKRSRSSVQLAVLTAGLPARFGEVASQLSAADSVENSSSCSWYLGGRLSSRTLHPSCMTFCTTPVGRAYCACAGGHIQSCRDDSFSNLQRDLAFDQPEPSTGSHRPSTVKHKHYKHRHLLAPRLLWRQCLQPTSILRLHSDSPQQPR